MLMHYARQSPRLNRQGSSGDKRTVSHRQRCAVRITYLKNRTRGQWRAHGRYLERETASRGEAGFNAREADVNISARLQTWQASKDELLWKFIISPEFGERADLERLTRDLMLRVEEDVGTSLEWVATVHRNTEHPHVHIAMRGVTATGKALRFSRDYVKRGVRDIAEEFCTRQMGFRTTLDVTEAERREINETRFTSLDRTILRNAKVSENGLEFAQQSEKARAQTHHVSARLGVVPWAETNR
jgi:type IV secretory pathway VirD2 relaxase